MKFTSVRVQSDGLVAFEDLPAHVPVPVCAGVFGSRFCRQLREGPAVAEGGRAAADHEEQRHRRELNRLLQCHLGLRTREWKMLDYCKRTPMWIASDCTV